MKNVIKKIASIAMAFTLLGTGTAVTRTISPKSNNTITANAADTCHCKTGRKYGTNTFVLDLKSFDRRATQNGIKGSIYIADLKEVIKCANCGKVYAYKTKEKNEKFFIPDNFNGNNGNFVKT